jgi:hypothetical protein
MQWCSCVNSNIVSIEDLNNCRTREVFIGDVMVVYNTYLDYVNRTHKILCANTTYANGMMTITLTVLAHLIERHEKNIVPGAIISIANFKILPKSGYDRGDCDCVISIVESIFVKIVSPTCWITERGGESIIEEL